MKLALLCFCGLLFSLLFAGCQLSETLDKNAVFEKLLIATDVNKSLEINATPGGFDSQIDVLVYNRSDGQLQLRPQTNIRLLYFDEINATWKDVPITSIVIPAKREFSLETTPSPEERQFDLAALLAENTFIDEDTITNINIADDGNFSEYFFVIFQNDVIHQSELRVLITAYSLDDKTQNVAAYVDVILKP